MGRRRPPGVLDAALASARERDRFFALLDKIYPGPREALEKAWGNPDLVHCHFYYEPGNRGIVSLLRAQDGRFSVGYLAFEQEATPLALERLRGDLLPLLPPGPQEELCFNLYGHNPRAIRFVQSLGFHLDISGFKYQYGADTPWEIPSSALRRRKYRPEDLGQFADLLDSAYAWLQQQSGRVVSHWAADPRALGQLLQTAEDAGNCLAYWLGDRLAGLCLIRSDGYIDNLAVHPEFQNRGFGRIILGRAVAKLLARRAPRIHLDVAAVNVRAQHFYESCGFSECGCFADHTFFSVQ